MVKVTDLRDAFLPFMRWSTTPGMLFLNPTENVIVTITVKLIVLKFFVEVHYEVQY